MNINVEFWSVFFLLEYRARISENIFEIGELALCRFLRTELRPYVFNETRQYHFHTTK